MFLNQFCTIYWLDFRQCPPPMPSPFLQLLFTRVILWQKVIHSLHFEPVRNTLLPTMTQEGCYISLTCLLQKERNSYFLLIARPYNSSSSFNGSKSLPRKVQSRLKMHPALHAPLWLWHGVGDQHLLCLHSDKPCLSSCQDKPFWPANTWGHKGINTVP